MLVLSEHQGFIKNTFTEEVKRRVKSAKCIIILDAREDLILFVVELPSGYVLKEETTTLTPYGTEESTALSYGIESKRLRAYYKYDQSLPEIDRQLHRIGMESPSPKVRLLNQRQYLKELIVRISEEVCSYIDCKFVNQPSLPPVQKEAALPTTLTIDVTPEQLPALPEHTPALESGNGEGEGGVQPLTIQKVKAAVATKIGFAVRMFLARIRRR